MLGQASLQCRRLQNMRWKRVNVLFSDVYDVHAGVLILAFENADAAQAKGMQPCFSCPNS
jgi:hypothetical protein